MPDFNNIRLAIIGMGYVGLPLAVAFAEKRKVLGLDTNKTRVQQLREGVDVTNEVASSKLHSLTNISFTDNLKDIENCNCFIVTVPTPVDESKKPDLLPLIQATRNIASILKKGDVVIYESTVYPGVTEEVCAPILEEEAGLTYNKDFYCGYSPERINPGDKEHTLSAIKKITSGSTEEAAEFVDSIYNEIVEAGTHKTKNIKVAEAAKVIENTQRDLNIALMNELSIICNLMGIETKEVLEAAGTKWNFLSFTPGLVGGHCIGVDPYYLTHKAESIGYNPQVILAGRQVNDRMPTYIAEKILTSVSGSGILPTGRRVTVLGLTFKENIPDIRNSKALELVSLLKEKGLEIFCHDPLANFDELKNDYDIELLEWDALPISDVLVVTVSHEAFSQRPLEEILSRLTKGALVVDLKSTLPREEILSLGFEYWSL